MTKTFQLSLLGLTSVILAGCAPVFTTLQYAAMPLGSVTSIMEDTATTPLIEAQNRWNEAKKASATQSSDSFVQPKNTTKPCKLLTPIDLEEDSQVYWDGACKGGFAVGIGRGTIIGKNTFLDYIYDASKKGQGPWVQKDHTNNISTYLFSEEGTNYIEQETLLFDGNDVFMTTKNGYITNDSAYIFEHDISGTKFYRAMVEGITYVRFISPIHDGTVEAMLPYDEKEPLSAMQKIPVRVTQRGNTQTRIKNQIVLIHTSDMMGYFDYWGAFNYDSIMDQTFFNIEKVFPKTKEARILEERYLQNLKAGKYKKTKGLDQETYERILHFYPENLDLRLQISQLKQENKNAAEAQAFREKIARAEAEAERRNQAMMNSINDAFKPRAMRPILKPTPIPALPEMKGPGSNVEVYRAQRINDNMISVQRVN